MQICRAYLLGFRKARGSFFGDPVIKTGWYIRVNTVGPDCSAPYLKERYPTSILKRLPVCMSVALALMSSQHQLK